MEGIVDASYKEVPLESFTIGMPMFVLKNSNRRKTPGLWNNNAMCLDGPIIHFSYTTHMQDRIGRKKIHNFY